MDKLQFLVLIAFRAYQFSFPFIDGEHWLFSGLLTQWLIHTGNGGNRPRKKARKIFLNVSENKSSDRKFYLIPFVSSAFYVE